MARPAVHLATILFAVISELFILQASASFFIEFVDRGGTNTGKLKLFECPEAAWTDSTAVARPKTTRPKTSASSSNQDIVCTEVVDDNAKTQIYTKANFFAINPRLNGDKKIKVGSVLLSSYYSNTFLGVTLTENTHWPVFLDEAKQMITFQTRFFTKFLSNINMDRVTNFAISGNFRVLSQPTPETTLNFKEFVKMMGNVQRVYANDAYTRTRYMQPENDRRTPQVTERMDDSLFTIHFLLQKMIDPCFAPVADADDLCSKQCQFLAVGFAANPGNDDAECSRAIAFGSCSLKMCMCAIRIMTLGCECSLKHTPMIKCSSALRTRITSNNRQ